MIKNSLLRVGRLPFRVALRFSAGSPDRGGHQPGQHHGSQGDDGPDQDLDPGGRLHVKRDDPDQQNHTKQSDTRHQAADPPPHREVSMR